MRVRIGALSERAQRTTEFFAECAILLGVDNDQTKRSLDRARV